MPTYKKCSVTNDRDYDNNVVVPALKLRGFRAFGIKEEIEQMLVAWDTGRIVCSIELGGFGPAYEQMIQVAAIEFTRATKDMTGLKNNDNESTDRFTAKCDEVVHKHDKDIGGMSGAQFGAARCLAWNWVVNGGPKRLQERAKKQGKGDNCIQISKAWPHIPETSAESK